MQATITSIDPGRVPFWSAFINGRRMAPALGLGFKIARVQQPCATLSLSTNDYSYPSVSYYGYDDSYGYGYGGSYCPPYGGYARLLASSIEASRPALR